MLNDEIVIDEATGLPVLPPDHYWSVSKIVFSYYNEPGDGVIKYETGKNSYSITLFKKVLDQPAIEENIIYTYKFFTGKKVISAIEPAVPATFLEYPQAIGYFLEPIYNIDKFVLDRLEPHEREQLDDLKERGFKKKIYKRLDLTEENIKKVAERTYLNWIKQGKIEEAQRFQIKENEKREEKYLGNYPPKGL